MRALLHLLPCLLGGLACAAWVWQAWTTPELRLLVLLLCLLVTVWAVRAGLFPARGLLVWDGQDWRWERAGADALLGRVQVRLDGQRHLLLEFLPSQDRSTSWLLPVGSIWLWPERRMAPQAWDALRRALYSINATALAEPAAMPEARL